MRAVLVTNDVVRLAAAEAALKAAGVESFVFDAGMSATEGSIGVFPRRLMVVDEDEAAARAILSALDAP